MRYAYSTITDLARDMADRLGLEVDAVTASLGEHRELWSLGGMPMRDLIATEHAVWADCTDGAEWPWSAEDAEQVAEEAEEAEEAERLEADPRASMRRLAADWEGEETLTQAIARAYNAPEEEVSVDTKTGDVWVGGGPGWLGDESLAELPAQLSAIGYHVGCGEDPEDHEWVATVEVDGGIEHCAVCGLRRRRVWPGSQRNPGEATEEVEYDAPTPEEG